VSPGFSYGSTVAVYLFMILTCNIGRFGLIAMFVWLQILFVNLPAESARGKSS
jgi:hypothetical protein